MRHQFFDEHVLDMLAGHAELVYLDDHARLDRLDDVTALGRTRVVVTGWGSQLIDSEALERMPSLGAVIHTGGSVRQVVTPGVMESGIVVSSQSESNAIAVAEYTLAMIILSLKGALLAQNAYAARRERIPVYDEYREFGTTGRTVGIVGASRVGRRVITLLGALGVTIKVSDPHIDHATAELLGVELVELSELMATSDVVSIHAPATAATHRMISRELMATMKPGATLINTARGSLVDEQALIELLQTGTIAAVLDVTEPTVPSKDSPLWTLPNVALTPHVAGALGTELSLLGRGAAEETVRFLLGDPLLSTVSPESLSYIA
jgi:phosphoglycerate dehydrogenase-like enzyme